MQDFRKLKVWQKAHDLALNTYRISADFPREELFGLRNTFRKTSVDIAALANALTLANRMEYYALLAHDLELLDDVVHTEYA